MRSAPFVVIDVTTIDEALTALGDCGAGARFLAGGQDILGELNARRSLAKSLVNLATVPELAGVVHQSGNLEIGAMTRMHEIEQLGADNRLRTAGTRHVLAAIASSSGPRAVRTLGTPGGNLVSRRAGTLWPTALTALEAQLRVMSSSGTHFHDVPEGISAARNTRNVSLIAGFRVSDERLRLVLGRAPVPTRFHLLSATCAVVIQPGWDVVRASLTWPRAVPRVREAHLSDLANGELRDRLVADVLDAVDDPEVHPQARLVMLSLVGRVLDRATGTNAQADHGTVIIDV